jgi:hypothetical protein
MRSPYPFTSVSDSHSILSPGCVFWGTPYTARKVTSPVNAMAKRSRIIVLTGWLYMVVIIIYRKASHFKQIRICYSSLMIDTDYCLLDPNLMDDRTSYTSDVTSRRAAFRDDVVNRDSRCVATAVSSELCEACHIIPHAKGDQVRSGPWYRSRRLFQTQYIKNLVRYRQVVINPRLEGINDIRNGILLNQMVHGLFGTSQVAFLQVSYSTQLSSISLS